MRFHPYADIFPLLDSAELDALTADIKSFGLREKIWLFQGKVLDGRNRFLACQKAKVKPQYRTFKGTEAGALALVVSTNIQRRHLTEAQRAMAAARVATFKQGRQFSSGKIDENESNAPRDAFSQAQAAEQMDVSRRSVQRAKQVIDHGSKALQDAVESGEVPLKKAADVVQLPKREQLAAATQKPEAKEPEPDNPLLRDDWEPEDDEDERLALAEKELAASIDKVMGADDKLAAAHAEIKRQAAEIAVLKLSRDGYMNGKAAVTKMLKAEQRKNERLIAQLEKARREVA